MRHQMNGAPPIGRGKTPYIEKIIISRIMVEFLPLTWHFSTCKVLSIYLFGWWNILNLTYSWKSAVHFLYHHLYQSKPQGHHLALAKSHNSLTTIQLQHRTNISVDCVRRHVAWYFAQIVLQELSTFIHPIIQRTVAWMCWGEPHGWVQLAPCVLEVSKAETLTFFV